MAGYQNNSKLKLKQVPRFRMALRPTPSIGMAFIFTTTSLLLLNVSFSSQVFDCYRRHICCSVILWIASANSTVNPVCPAQYSLNSAESWPKTPFIHYTFNQWTLTRTINFQTTCHVIVETNIQCIKQLALRNQRRGRERKVLKFKTTDID